MPERVHDMRAAPCRHAMLAMACVIALSACAHHAPASADLHHERLEHRQAEFFAALAARDADATARLFADDAVLQVAGMPAIQGRAAIRQFYGNVFRFLSASAATPHATRVAESGDMAYGIGRVINEFRGPEDPIEFAGKYAVVWRRVEGDWVIVVYSVSSDQAEAGR